MSAADPLARRLRLALEDEEITDVAPGADGVYALVRPIEYGDAIPEHVPAPVAPLPAVPAPAATLQMTLEQPAVIPGLGERLAEVEARLAQARQRRDEARLRSLERELAAVEAEAARTESRTIELAREVVPAPTAALEQALEAQARELAVLRQQTHLYSRKEAERVLAQVRGRGSVWHTAEDGSPRSSRALFSAQVFGGSEF